MNRWERKLIIMMRDLSLTSLTHAKRWWIN